MEVTEPRLNLLSQQSNQTVSALLFVDRKRTKKRFRLFVIVWGNKNK